MGDVERLVRYRLEGRECYGRLVGDRVEELDGDLFGEHQANGNTYALSEVRLLAPCRPTKAVCVGLNYRHHARELTMELPQEPVIFIKPPTSIINPGEEIIYWPEVERLDFEAELVVVMGKKAHRVGVEEAEGYIFGYTAGNDVTARDLQARDIQWTRAKSFDTFLPLGPVIVKGIDPANLRVQSFLNGELRQDGHTSQLIFKVPQLVSFISRVMTLLPGDIIMTGTPAGVGPMQQGDTVEIRIEGIGSLTNKVAPPPGSQPS